METFSNGAVTIDVDIRKREMYGGVFHHEKDLSIDTNMIVSKQMMQSQSMWISPENVQFMAAFLSRKGPFDWPVNVSIETLE